MIESALPGIVAARICHDLVSPVGAIGNAMDLMEEFDGADTGEERRIIRDSAGRASAILRLHRLAFGNPGGSDTAITRAELRERVDPVLAGPRVELRWTGIDATPCPQPMARAVALMAMSARTLLGMRGRLTVTLALGALLPVGVAAEGEAVALGAAEEGWLLDRATTLPEPRQVELALLPRALAEAGARLAVRGGPGSVLLTALPT